MQSLRQLPLKKPFLYALIGSVSLSALLGILVILIGDFGDVEVRILLTSLTVSAASLCGVACGAAIESKRTQILPFSGILLALLGAILLVAGIWARPHAEAFWKTTTTICLFAAACSHMSLLLLARLASKYRWSIPAAAGAVFGLAAIITAILWGEFENEAIFRVLGVIAILDGAMTIVIPILHRLSRSDLESSTTETAAASLIEIEREIEQLQTRLAELEQRRDQMVPSRRTSSDVE